MEQDFSTPAGQELRQGLEAHGEGRFDEAHLHYSRALEHDADCANAMFLLGTLEFQRNRHLDAREWLEKAISLDRNNRDAWINLGLTFRAIGQPGAAQSALEEASRLGQGRPLGSGGPPAASIGTLEETHWLNLLPIESGAPEIRLDGALVIIENLEAEGGAYFATLKDGRPAIVVNIRDASAASVPRFPVRHSGGGLQIYLPPQAPERILPRLNIGLAPKRRLDALDWLLHFAKSNADGAGHPTLFPDAPPTVHELIGEYSRIELGDCFAAEQLVIRTLEETGNPEGDPGLRSGLAQTLGHIESYLQDLVRHGGVRETETITFVTGLTWSGVHAVVDFLRQHPMSGFIGLDETNLESPWLWGPPPLADWLLPADCDQSDVVAAARSKARHLFPLDKRPLVPLGPHFWRGHLRQSYYLKYRGIYLLLAAWIILSSVSRRRGEAGSAIPSLLKFLGIFLDKPDARTMILADDPLANDLLKNARAVLAAFPSNCRFVFVWRDLRDRFYSAWKRGEKLPDASPEEPAELTDLTCRLAAEFGNVMVVQFEKFVDDPGERSRLLDFLGLPGSQVAEGKFFRPEESRKTVGRWRQIPEAQRPAWFSGEGPASGYFVGQ